LGRTAAALVLCLAVWAWAVADPEQPEPERLVSNVFLDTDLRLALQDVAQQAGVHIICDDTVNGFISLDLEEVPLEEALRLMLMAGGYSCRKIDPKCYLVGAGDPQSPTFNLLSSTAVMPLRHIKAAKTSDLLLSDYYDDYVKVDAERNVVVVTGPQSIIDRVAADLARIDVARAQVMIEAVVVDVETDKAREFMTNWSLTENVSNPEGTRTVSFADLTLGYTSLHMRELLLALRALVTNGIARIRAEPSVTTLDGEQAEIFVGREEYFSILAGGTITYPYYRLESIKSGITLSVAPRIVEDGLVTLQFAPEVSDVVARGEEGLPVVSRRRVSTTVRVRDGETVAVGGLAAELVRKERTGVPVLRDLPIVGMLFSRTETSSRKSEVIVLLTPHIIRGPGLAPVEATESEQGRPASNDPPEAHEQGSAEEPGSGETGGSAMQVPAGAPASPTDESAGSHQVAEAAPARVAGGVSEPSAVSSVEPAHAAGAGPLAGQTALARPRAPVPPAEVVSEAGDAKAEERSPQPAIAITKPTAETVVHPGESVGVVVCLKCEKEVDRVWVYVNRQPRGVFGKPPYEMELTTGSLVPGRHRLEAMARLSDGTWLRSEEVWVRLVERGEEEADAVS
jgi:type II secretory pathway component GspD/PulD (secretin)